MTVQNVSSGQSNASAAGTSAESNAELGDLFSSLLALLGNSQAVLANADLGQQQSFDQSPNHATQQSNDQATSGPASISGITSNSITQSPSQNVVQQVQQALFGADAPSPTFDNWPTVGVSEQNSPHTFNRDAEPNPQGFSFEVETTNPNTESATTTVLKNLREFIDPQRPKILNASPSQEMLTSETALSSAPNATSALTIGLPETTNDRANAGELSVTKSNTTLDKQETGKQLTTVENTRAESPALKEAEKQPATSSGEGETSSNANPDPSPISTTPITHTHTHDARGIESETPTEPAFRAHVAHQVMNSIAPLRTLPNGTHRVTLRLNPEELGQVQLRVVLDGDTIHIQMHTERTETASVIRDSARQLQQEMEASGLQMGSFDVESEGRSAQQEASSHSQRLHDATNEEKSVGDLRQLAQQITSDSDVDLRL